MNWQCICHIFLVYSPVWKQHSWKTRMSIVVQRDLQLKPSSWVERLRKKNDEWRNSLVLSLHFLSSCSLVSKAVLWWWSSSSKSSQQQSTAGAKSPREEASSNICCGYRSKKAESISGFFALCLPYHGPLCMVQWWNWAFPGQAAESGTSSEHKSTLQPIPSWIWF